MNYTCPVCGFHGLTEPAYDKQGHHSYEICPCCGFQFGFDDYEMQREDGSYLEPSESIIAYRKNWLADGAVIFSPDSFPKHQQKANRVLKQQLLEQLKQINVHDLPS
ncbi:hypothetical protein [Bacillus vallismortis]|uniref:Uncharacterized protein n=1 Tax=Bacillus vallismortis TaxID=72361 RepID=A0AAP3CFL4_BACVA|nr:hypothetical protein [Bacillus vallismortis]MBG9768529.1 hypothetical protein [Bacillus vallismortis]MCY8307840.1 hypothetical protein [Bacillus vallismortis]MCY8315526.1 hypothetical protein [Bacillus vallismortis]MCY8426621.1 hypothetical protein [Bacillus vallismortis]MCY8598163.1 hypothetical protein [Bacillus vallismortis]